MGNAVPLLDGLLLVAMRSIELNYLNLEIENALDRIFNKLDLPTQVYILKNIKNEKRIKFL